jgi:hypothetical protein
MATTQAFDRLESLLRPTFATIRQSSQQWLGRSAPAARAGLVAAKLRAEAAARTSLRYVEATKARVASNPLACLSVLAACVWLGSAFAVDFQVWQIASHGAAALVTVGMLFSLHSAQQRDHKKLQQDLRELGGSLHALHARLHAETLDQLHHMDDQVESLDDRTLVRLRASAISLARRAGSELQLRSAFDLGTRND